MIATPLLLAAVERGAAADGDQSVLEGAPPLVVDMDVTRGDGGDPQIAGELAESGVPAGVASLVRALELDVEAVLECGRDERGRVGILDPSPYRAQPERQTNPSFSSSSFLERKPRAEAVGTLLRPGTGVRLGQSRQRLA